MSLRPSAVRLIGFPCLFVSCFFVSTFAWAEGNHGVSNPGNRQTLPAIKFPVAISKEAEINQRAFNYAALLISKEVGQAVTRYGNSAMFSPTKSYWKPTWNVRLSDPKFLPKLVLEMEIADGSGELVGLINHDLRYRLRGRMAPNGLPISREQAIRAASRLVHKIGLDDELGTPQARLIQLTLPPTAAGSIWYVLWPRQYKGLSYSGQYVIVDVQAETGIIKSLKVLFTTAPPQEERRFVSEAQATETANAWVGSMGLKQLSLQPVTREVVQRNTFWEPRIPTQRLSGAGVIAWGVHYKDSIGQTYSVWIDASGGTIAAGGSTLRNLPWKKPDFQQLLVPRRIDK